MKSTLILSSRLTNLIRRWKINSTKGITIIFLLAAYSLTNTTLYAQYSSSKSSVNKQQKEEAMIQINSMLLIFLQGVEMKYELTQQEIIHLQTELQKHRAKEKNQKTLATDQRTEQILKEKITVLYGKKEKYKKMERETIRLLTLIEENVPKLKEQNRIARAEQKQTAKQFASQSEREMQIKKLEKESVVLMDKVKQIAVSKNLVQHNEKGKQIEQKQLAAISQKPIHKPAHGYYIVFGSFASKKNADVFVNVLKKQYANVVALGNENLSGMYRIGIGPYPTKKDATIKKPINKDCWILEVDIKAVPRAIVYSEMHEN